MPAPNGPSLRTATAPSTARGPAAVPFMAAGESFFVVTIKNNQAFHNEYAFVSGLPFVGRARAPPRAPRPPSPHFGAFLCVFSNCSPLKGHSSLCPARVCTYFVRERAP
ncbi:hypothetical protein EVAR_93737_1 [Eumeta japonica]|uniref:Uncharacterized protein n=1 Tax=Eumeta variegata TaxID=151549 RepID=A0A4C1U2M2_EUMVA|nr:hypothetical protein EVAR_93737_1 [Eumeta japonica]